jgi:hypothetical protein
MTLRKITCESAFEERYGKREHQMEPGLWKTWNAAWNRALEAADDVVQHFLGDRDASGPHADGDVQDVILHINNLRDE